jgi:hypothetical protein
VSVSGTLEGPGAWHIKGKLTFTILWWDISKSFDERWGTLPPAIMTQTDVKQLLAAEISRAENWATALPPASDALVTLAPRIGDTAAVAHPFSRLTFSQTIVPLGLTMEKFGDTLIAGANRFDVTQVTVGGVAVSAPTMVSEHFARGQVPQHERGGQAHQAVIRSDVGRRRVQLRLVSCQSIVASRFRWNTRRCTSTSTH